MPVFGENSATLTLEVRLTLTNERLLDDLHALDAVVDRARAERFERLHFVFVVRDDQFAGASMGDVVPGAELVEQSGAVDAVPCFEAPRRVVDPGVNDLAVVGARPQARTRFALENADAPSAAGDGQRCGQTHHACADHCHIDLFHGLCAATAELR